MPGKFYREVIQDFRKGIEADELMILMLVLTTLSSVLPIGTKGGTGLHQPRSGGAALLPHPHDERGQKDAAL